MEWKAHNLLCIAVIRESQDLVNRRMKTAELITFLSIEKQRPSKTDSAPVRGDGYEPESSKFRLRANAETSHSVRYDMVVVVGVLWAVVKSFHMGW